MTGPEAANEVSMAPWCVHLSFRYRFLSPQDNEYIREFGKNYYLIP
jgi:hypothetical protein